MKKKYVSFLIVSMFVLVNAHSIISQANNPHNDTTESLGMSDHFSWKDHLGKDWTTPVKDQMLSGPCWAFAAISVLESVIKIREDYPDFYPDLSEQYILSCLPDSGSMMGGSSYLALQYMMETTARGNNQNGAIPEWCFPYQETDDVPCSSKDTRWIEQLIPIDTVGKWTSQGSSSHQQRIKDDIVEKGPVVATITITDDLRSWGYRYRNPTNYYKDPGPVSHTNHVVVIIGWKDDPSIDNGGYWICKNSWEPYWGYDGFFNIEYGALNIDKGDIIWVDYDSSHNLAPVAQLNEVIVGSCNTAISFDASDSFDVDGEIVEYTWDFGDGNQATGKTVNHEYDTRGLYTITLTVTDGNGKQGHTTNACLVDMWKENDFWTFDIDEFTIKNDDLGYDMEFDASIPDFTLTVSEITSDEYVLDVTGSLKGGLSLDLAGLDISTSFSRLTKISGELTLKKSNLCIEDVSLSIKGMIKVSIADLPIKIPFPFEIVLDPVIDNGITFIDFPMQINHCWCTGDATVSLDGEINSFYLNLITKINAIAKLFGKGFLTEEYEELLPDIDISEWLEMQEIENSFSIQSHPRAFVCTDIEQVTVPAGSFESYKVEFDYEPYYAEWGLSFGYFFSPDVAMLSDATLEFGDFARIHAELTDTSLL